MQELAGRTAVITGGASGIGRAMADRFAAEGMNLVLADIDAQALERAVEELRGTGASVIGQTVDVSAAHDVEELAARAREAFGNIHVLCNNAGVAGFLGGRLWEARDKDWEWTFGINYWSVVHGIRAFLPEILRSGDEAHIVNTASIMGLIRGEKMYGVTKHAVVALSEALYAELHETGARVGVSVLCPGPVKTNLHHGKAKRPAHLVAGDDPEQEEREAALREETDKAANQEDPAKIADLVVQSIRERRFYILNDHSWDGAVLDRAERIVRGGEPAIAETEGGEDR